MINGIQIDIEKITDEQLYSLRKILPRKDYRYVTQRVKLILNHLGSLKTEKAREKQKKEEGRAVHTQRWAQGS